MYVDYLHFSYSFGSQKLYYVVALPMSQSVKIVACPVQIFRPSESKWSLYTIFSGNLTCENCMAFKQCQIVVTMVAYAQLCYCEHIASPRVLRLVSAQPQGLSPPLLLYRWAFLLAGGKAFPSNRNKDSPFLLYRWDNLRFSIGWRESLSIQ